jgi:prepilin-type N-terminal cleavage/methylation domain-containing protein
MKTSNSGFTLLEIMLVIGVIVIIAAISRDFYGRFVAGAQLDNNAKIIIYDLRNTRDKARNGLNDRNWGIHFVNSTSDYYEIFSTPSNYADPVKSVIVTNYLQNGLVFGFPTEGTNSDIIFTKISGQVASSSIIIKAGLTERVITAQEQGLIN